MVRGRYREWEEGSEGGRAGIGSANKRHKRLWKGLGEGCGDAGMPGIRTVQRCGAREVRCHAVARLPLTALARQNRV